jgi:hypothetical protein
VIPKKKGKTRKTIDNGTFDSTRLLNPLHHTSAKFIEFYEKKQTANIQGCNDEGSCKKPLQ